MSGSASLEVVKTGSVKPFANTKVSDVVFYSSNSNQAILIGCGIDESKSAGLTISESNVVFSKDLKVEGVIDAQTIKQSATNLGEIFINKTGDSITGSLSLTGSLNASNLIQAGSNLSSFYASKTGGNINGALTVTGALNANTVLQAGSNLSFIYLSKAGDTVNGTLTVSNLDITGSLTKNAQPFVSDISACNLSQIISATPFNGYSNNIVTVPTIITRTVPFSYVNLTYGRVELTANDGISLFAGASVNLTVRHNLGNSNYWVYATPDDDSAVQIKIQNISNDTFDILVKNPNLTSIGAQGVNYQLVQSSSSNMTTLAQPVNILNSNLTLSSLGSNDSITVFTLSNQVLDPQSYQIFYGFVSGSNSRTALTGSNLIYTNTGSSQSLNLVLKARNPYVDDATKTINITLTEIIILSISTSASTSTTASLTVSYSGTYTSVTLELYNINIHPQEVLRLECEDTDGSIAPLLDSTFKHTFTRVGTPVISAAEKITYGNSSAFFPNTLGNYYVSSATADLTFGSGDFTMEFWINWSGLYTTTSSAILSNQAGGDWTNGNWVIYVSNSSTLTLNSGGLGININGPTITANKWTHVALVRYGSNILFYINGVRTTTHTVSGSLDMGSTNIIVVGAIVNQNVDYFSGYLDHVRIVKTALYTSDSFSISPINTVSNITASSFTFNGLATSTQYSVKIIPFDNTTAGPSNSITQTTAPQGFPTSTAPFSTFAACYSSRRVVSTYTGAIFRIRRNSDNIIQDFYSDFNQTYLTTGAEGTGTSYATWIGNATGYIQIWYDQASGAKHATNNNNNTTQPFISLQNGKYIAAFTNSLSAVLTLPSVRGNTLFCHYLNTNSTYGSIIATAYDYSQRFGSIGATNVNGDANAGDWFFNGAGTKVSYNNGVASTTVLRGSYNRLCLSVQTPTWSTSQTTNQQTSWTKLGTDGYTANNMRGMNGYMVEMIIHNTTVLESEMVAYDTNRLF